MKLYKCNKVVVFKIDPNAANSNELVEGGLYHLDEDAVADLVSEGILEEVPEDKE
jgi:hypothetical protein